MNQVLILAGEMRSDDVTGVSHAPDCSFVWAYRRWAAGIGYTRRRYVKVPARIVAQHVGRCGFCGGGR